MTAFYKSRLYIRQGLLPQWYLFTLTSFSKAKQPRQAAALNPNNAKSETDWICFDLPLTPAALQDWIAVVAADAARNNHSLSLLKLRPGESFYISDVV